MSNLEELHKLYLGLERAIKESEKEIKEINMYLSTNKSSEYLEKEKRKEQLNKYLKAQKSAFKQLKTDIYARLPEDKAVELNGFIVSKKKLNLESTRNYTLVFDEEFDKKEFEKYVIENNYTDIFKVDPNNIKKCLASGQFHIHDNNSIIDDNGEEIKHVKVYVGDINEKPITE